jgi:methionine-rich copper-binding protein CopC
MTLSRSFAALAILTGFFIVLTAVFIASTAQAHPRLVASNPAPNSVVSALQSIQLSFSEKLVEQSSGADILRLGGKGHAPTKITGAHSWLERNGKAMTIQLERLLDSGSYQLVWRAESTDMHQLSGNFNFQVK